MADILTAPEVRFRFGDVRVTLWGCPVDTEEEGPRRFRLALERKSGLSGRDDAYSPILEDGDIPRAIAALEKAAAYARKAARARPNLKPFSPASEYLRERIP